ncbi:hypothetical protein SCUP234_10169 [Seiridium cupressi]
MSASAILDDGAANWRFAGSIKTWTDATIGTNWLRGKRKQLETKHGQPQAFAESQGIYLKLLSMGSKPPASIAAKEPSSDGMILRLSTNPSHLQAGLPEREIRNAPAAEEYATLRLPGDPSDC